MSLAGNRVTHLADWYNHAERRLLNQPVIEIADVGREDLARLFARLEFNRGVEIGTERGLYAETLCRANPQLHLHCVDPYRAYKGYREHTSQSKLDSFYEEARQRLNPYRCQIMRLSSVEAATAFADEPQDFVYIDGNHSLVNVIQDLWHWVPKVRKGGICAGHDWINRKRPDYAMHVPEAVTAYCTAFNIKPLFLLGRKAIIEGEVRDKPRSYFWVKE